MFRFYIVGTNLFFIETLFFHTDINIDKTKYFFNSTTKLLLK